MKKKVLFSLISYILGILAFEVLDVSTLVFACISFVLIVCIRNFMFDARNKILAFLMCGFFIFGVIYTSFFNSIQTDNISHLTGKNMTVTGRIVKVFDNNNEYYDYYEFEISDITIKNNTEFSGGKEKVKLSLKKYEQRSSCEQYNYGDVLTLRASLGEISKPLNEGEANYNISNKADGKFFELTGEYDKSEFVCSKINYFNIRDLAMIVRKYGINAIDKYFSGDDASLLKGILLSKKTFTDEHYTRLADSGMMHVTVASGLHAGCVFALMTWLCFALRIKKKWTYLIAGLSLWIFAFLQAMTPSIVRAVIMLCFYMFSQLVSRDYDKEHILYITAFIMLFANPYIIFDLGFILSFASVLGIALFSDIINEYLLRIIKIKKLSSAISVTLSVQILLLPILAYYFNTISVYSLLANLLIVPVITPVLAVGFLFILLSGVGSVIPICIAFVLKIFVKYINGVIYFVTVLPFAKINIFSKNVLSMCIYYLILASVFVLFTRGNRKYNFTYVTICTVLVVWVTVVSVYSSSLMRVSFINVGQGDATLIKIPHGQTVVIDGGGSSAVSKKDLGEEIFVPYLRSNGVNTIDYAILSHYDKDHAQGIAAALRLMKVENLILPYRGSGKNSEYKKIIEEIAVQNKINVLYFKEGDVLEVGDAVFEAFAPTKKNGDNRAMSENDKSLVLKLTYGNTSFLFTGDIETAAIGKLVKYEDKIRADVLKVAHHGSDESNPTKFIRTVKPEYALISVGKDNIYDLPSRYTLKLLEKEAVNVFRTDKCGSVSFYVDKDEIKWIDTFY